MRTNVNHQTDSGDRLSQSSKSVGNILCDGVRHDFSVRRKSIDQISGFPPIEKSHVFLQDRLEKFLAKIFDDSLRRRQNQINSAEIRDGAQTENPDEKPGRLFESSSKFFLFVIL